MLRRKFISQSFKGSLIPFFIGGKGVNSLAKASLLPAAVCDYDDRVLVIIHLMGANDVINAMVPMDQFTAYQTHRPTIHLPQSSLITLDNSLPSNQLLGLHPSLLGFKELYDEGNLGIIQRVGYPVINRSHFSSESNWLRGADGINAGDDEGWIGSFLKDRYPLYKGVPYAGEPDPLGIMLGDGSSAAFGTNESFSHHIDIHGQDPAGFFNIISSLSGDPISTFANSDHGDLLQYISGVEKSSQIYSERISQVFNAGTNSMAYPDSILADQLKTIARFLSGGSRTKVFFARFFGWDTHGNQVEAGNTTMGTHSNLLLQTAEAMKAFQVDLKSLGLDDRVTTLVFSEFGRKIKETGGRGTDHGTLTTMYAMGKHVKPGVYGNNIDLNDQDDQSAANPAQMENDYRSVFSAFLKDWMGADNPSIQQAFKHADSQILFTDRSYIEPNSTVDSSCYFQQTEPVTISLQAKVFLEGFYRVQSRDMHTDLYDRGLLPADQPFGFIGYRGGESIGTFPNGTVDWILCELRSTENFVVASQKAVLLRSDGSLTELDGNTTISFPGQFPEDYHLVIYHRSHIPIISSGTTRQDQIVEFRFDSPSMVMGENQLKDLGAGIIGMLSGDLDQNGIINAEDYHIFNLNQGRVNAYLGPDINGDGEVNIPDTQMLNSNRGHIAFPDLFPNLTD